MKVGGPAEDGDRRREFTCLAETLLLPDVHAVVAYYLRRRDEVLAYLKRREEGAEVLRVKIEAEYPGSRKPSCWHAAEPESWTVLRLASDADQWPTLPAWAISSCGQNAAPTSTRNLDNRNADAGSVRHERRPPG